MRLPNLRGAEGKRETGRHDAHDLGVEAVEFHMPADDVAGAAEALLPDAVADDGGARGAVAVLFGGEEAPEHAGRRRAPERALSRRAAPSTRCGATPSAAPIVKGPMA